MKITRALLESLTFRPFTKDDYYGFSGVQSPCPMISDDTNILVIIDGDYAELYANLNDCGEADDICENIRELPYKTEKQRQVESQIEALELQLAELKSSLLS